MDAETKRILHDATIKVLKEVGVALDSEEALSLCAGEGVRVDENRGRVYPSEDDIERSIASVPSSFVLSGRGENSCRIGPGDLQVLAGGGAVRVLDLDGTYSDSSWDHLERFNRLLEHLPSIGILLNQVDPPVCGPDYYRTIAYRMFAGTTKPICLQAGCAEDVRSFARMGEAVRGSRRAHEGNPVFMTGTNAEPPLRISRDSCEIIIEAARLGIPCGIGDYGMMGSTAPITVEGTLVQRNAVQLTGVLLIQLARRGAPCYYVGTSGSCNMRTLDPIMANPHACRVVRFATELGASYGLPVWSNALTDAKEPDVQAACERSVMFLQALRAGANIIQGPTAMMDQMMLASYVQAVIDADIAEYILRAEAPLLLGEERLSTEAIAEVIREGGALKFADHPQTLAHLGEEDWEPLGFRYESFTGFSAGGRKSLLEAARERAEGLLSLPPAEIDVRLAKELQVIAKKS